MVLKVNLLSKKARSKHDLFEIKFLNASKKIVTVHWTREKIAKNIERLDDTRTEVRT